MPKTIECNSEIGITIGLIDTLINTARVLRPRLDMSAMISGQTGDEYQPIRDALTDLCSCKELSEVIHNYDCAAMRVIHDAAALLRTPPLTSPDSKGAT